MTTYLTTFRTGLLGDSSTQRTLQQSFRTKKHVLDAISRKKLYLVAWGGRGRKFKSCHSDQFGGSIEPPIFFYFLAKSLEILRFRDNDHRHILPCLPGRMCLFFRYDHMFDHLWRFLAYFWMFFENIKALSNSYFCSSSALLSASFASIESSSSARLKYSAACNAAFPRFFIIPLSLIWVEIFFNI